MARRTDVAPSGPLSLPATGLGGGWEPGVLMAVTLLLLSFGLVTLYSASAFMAQRSVGADYYFVLRQALGGAIGLVALVVCSRIPYHLWQDVAWPLLVLSWLLLVVIVLPGTEAFAPPRGGARRWFQVGAVSFQPSDLAKIALIVWTAALAIRKKPHFRNLRRGLLPFLVVWSAVLVPVLVEPDLSTTFLMGLVAAVIVFHAGGRIGHFVFLGALVAPVAAKLLFAGYRGVRLPAFRDPCADALGAGYQVCQSKIAVGSGGLMGVGFGEGRQKFGFLPEPHNDFIFSMLGEEWGLLGVSVVVVLYLLLILVGFRIASRAPDLFGELVAVGITSMIALHAFLHMFVGLGLLPPTGLALPLMSYGRSNLLVTLASIGILMSIARAIPEGRARRA